MRFVWRHLPLTDVHPQAELAAAGGRGGRRSRAGSGRCTTCCSTRQDHLTKPDLLALRRASSGWTAALPASELLRHVHAGRVAQDVESADLSGVSGTPTFFVNGRRHYGAFDAASLTQAIADRSRPGADPGLVVRGER